MNPGTSADAGISAGTDAGTNTYANVETPADAADVAGSVPAPGSTGRTRGLVYLVLAAVLFGIMPIIAKIAYASGMSVLQVVFSRSFVGAVVLGISCLVTRRSFRLDRKIIPRMIIAGTMFTFTWLTLYGSYVYISSGVSTSLHYLYPALVVLAMSVFMHERMDALKWIAVALCFGGVMLAANPLGEEFSLRGVILAGSSAIFFSTYTVLIGTKGLKEIDSMVCSFYMCFVSLVIVSAMFPLLGESLTANLNHVGIICGISLGIFCTAIPVYLYLVGTQVIGPSRASIISTLEPVSAMIFGIIILDEGIFWYVIVGCLMIILGVGFVAQPGKRGKLETSGNPDEGTA